MKSTDTTQISLTDITTCSDSTEKTECPACHTHSIIYKESLLEHVLRNVSAINENTIPHVSGEYCCNDDCEWFKLQRAPTPARGGDRNGVDMDDSIRLNDRQWVSRFDDRVELNGSVAVFMDADSCPECGDDVEVHLQRHVLESERDNSSTKDVYRPVYSECVNYGVSGGGCSYREE